MSRMIRQNFKKALDEYERMIAGEMPIDIGYLAELLESENEEDDASNVTTMEFMVDSGIFGEILEERKRREAAE